MRVLHVNQSDTGGGHARSLLRLHAGLCEVGVESRILVARKQGTSEDVAQARTHLSSSQRIVGWLARQRLERDMRRYSATRPSGCELFSDDRAPFGQELLAQCSGSDVVNLHFVSGLIDFRTFLRPLAKRQPTVWRLSDMAPFTGGCHFDSGCGKFTARCGGCPQLGSTREDDLSRRIWQRKRRVFELLRDDELQFVAQSKWLRGEIEKSSLLSRFPVEVIPNGIDTRAYCPRPKAACRTSLGLPPEACVLLFVAGTATNPRKGFDYLHSALQRVARTEQSSRLLILTVGRHTPFRTTPPEHVHLGVATNDLFLAQIYSASDALVIPSLQDNLPNTVLEAMACGTPVIGFDTGGIPDMVRHGRNGLLAKCGDAEDLSEKIVQAIRVPDALSNMGREAREIAVAEYRQDIVARRFVKLYEQVLERRRP